MILILLLAGGLLADLAGGETAWKTTVWPTLSRFCLDCHSGDKAKGGLDLALLADEKQAKDRPDLWLKIARQLDRKQMPPATSPQPMDNERKAIRTWIDQSAHADIYNKRIKPLLTRYCYDCHSPGGGNKGGVNLSYIETQAEVGNLAKLWPTVQQVIKDNEMPPKNRPEPSPSERELLGHWLTYQIDLQQVDCTKKTDTATMSKAAASHTWSRPLSSTEYANTITALLGVDVPAGVLSKDGDSSLSPIIIDERLDAAVLSVDRFFAADAGVAAKHQRDRLINGRPSASAAAVLSDAASIVWRRPAASAEVAKAAQKVAASAATWPASLGDGLVLLLMSPNCQMLVEPVDGRKGQALRDPYALAARLSYLLWQEPPDPPLSAAADSKAILADDEIAAQAARMLRDPRSIRFARRLARNYLGIAVLGGAKLPDPKRFPQFDEALRQSMEDEAAHFLMSILRDGRPLSDLVDAGYVWVDGRMAKHYGLPGVTGDGFRKVAVRDGQRGGIAGLAAVLTATSYPGRTSVVMRGKWLVEQILGDDIPPPPPNVPTLEESAADNANMTMRQRLEQHRRKPECASCHQRMDPLGFCLEKYDPIGRIRTTDGSLPIDDRAELISGESFTGMDGLRTYLRSNNQKIIDRFSRKLLGQICERGGIPECDIRDLFADLSPATTGDALFRRIVTSVHFRQRFFTTDSPGR